MWTHNKIKHLAKLAKNVNRFATDPKITDDLRIFC